MNQKEQQKVEKIMKDYQPKEVTSIDKLKELDKKAKKGANIFAYVFGIIGSLILGLGMSIAMKVILAEYMFLGIGIGVIGLVMVIINYFIYKKLLVKGKNKYASEILELSKELLNK